MCPPKTLLVCGLLASATNLATAQLFDLEFTGVTDSASAVGATPISAGTSFQFDVTFSTPTLGSPAAGAAYYGVTAATAVVGGTPYTATAASSELLVLLIDPSNGSFPGYYLPAVISSVAGGFAPAFTNATPAFSAVSPVATVFSGSPGALESSLSFTTGSGVLALGYDATVGVNAALIASPVPEPAAGAAVAAAALVGFGMWRRLRAA